MIKISFKSFLYLSILLTCNVDLTFAQTEPSTKDGCFNNAIGFVHYLADGGKPKLALLALHDIDCGNAAYYNDSVNYLKGVYNFGLKQLDTAASAFLKVSEQSYMYTKSRFFAAYGLTFTKKYNAAKKILDTSVLIKQDDSLLYQLKCLQLSGIGLLQRDTIAARKYISSFSYGYYSLSDQQKLMSTHLLQIGQMPHKFPFVAAMLSAVVPGAGKWYVGRKKQALGSFFQMAALGLLAWEAYHKHGVNSAPFYLFGSAFTVFYLSNIYGSALAVKIKRNENNIILDNKILLDMHIPLRSIFN